MTRVALVIGGLLALAGAAGHPVEQRSLRTDQGGCVVTATPVAFGQYNPLLNTPLDRLGSLAFECHPLPGSGRVRNVYVQINQGSSGSFNRAMINGADRLYYNLYVDSVRTIIWGDGSGGTQALFMADPLPNQQITVPIYGRIFPAQDVPAGAYVDSLTVTILF